MNIIDTNTLHNIARVAWGSSEKDDGGRGYMGVIKDEQGRLRVIKYDTHFSQTSSANKNDLSQRAAAQLLRDILVEIADRSGLSAAQVSAIRNKLGIVDDNDNNDLYDPPKKLLERKIVASIVKMIDKNIWSKAISKDINIGEYSSKHKDTRFSTVIRNVGDIEGGAILKPLVNDKKSVDNQKNINKGLKCLLNEAKSGNSAHIKSCLGLIKPTEAKKLYEAEKAASRLTSRSDDDHESLDEDLEILTEVYGLDEKKKNKLKSAISDAWYSDTRVDDCYDKLEDELAEIRSGDLEKWKDLNEKYQDFYFKIGLVKQKLTRSETDQQIKNMNHIAKLPIRKVISLIEKEANVPANAFNDCADIFDGDENLVEKLLEKFGCSLDDLEKLEELGKCYDKAYTEANDEFNILEGALKTKFANDNRIDSWCNKLRDNFKVKLNSVSNDTVASLENLKRQLSSLPETINKYHGDNKLTTENLLDKNLDQLFSLKEDIEKANKKAEEDIKKAEIEENCFLQEKYELMSDLPDLGKKLGDSLKKLNAESDTTQIDNNLNKLKDIFKKVVDGANIKNNYSELFATIRHIYTDLESVYPSDFVAFFKDFNPTVFTADVVSEIRTGVGKLCNVAKMRDRLNEVGKELKEKSGHVDDARIDDKISALKSAFGKKILDPNSLSESINEALKLIEDMVPVTFLDDLTVEQLVEVNTNEVQADLAMRIVVRDIKGALNKLGDDFKKKNRAFDLQLPNGEKVESLAGSKIDALIDKKIDALNEKFGNGLNNKDFMKYGYERNCFREKIDFWAKLPVSAFLGLSVDKLVESDTNVLEPLVLAQDRLLGNDGVAMKLQRKADFYVVADRLSNFVSGLVTKLANGEISVADATREVNVIAELPISALVEIEDLGSIWTDEKIRTKAVDALKQAIFAGMDNKKSVNFVFEFGGADVLAFINSGTLSSKDYDLDKWHNDMKNLTSLVADKCKGWHLGAAIRFAVDQYSVSSSSLRRNLPDQYTLYQELLVKLQDKDDSTANLSISALKKVVENFCDDRGLSREICSELYDLIELVEGLSNDYRTIGPFNETKEDGLAMLALLEDNFGKDAKNDKTLEDAIRNAGTLLKIAIENESTFDGVLAFSKVLKEFKQLTPQQFASLREEDLEAIKQDNFELRVLVQRAQNLGMVEKFKPQLESAINRLSNRLLKESQYFDSDGKIREVVGEADVEKLRENIDALRLRLESRIVPQGNLAEDASGLIARSQRDLAALDNLDFNSFVIYGEGNLDKLFARLDYLVELEDRFVITTNEAKFQTTDLDGTVDVRIAELKKYLDASVLWDAGNIDELGWLTTDKDGRPHNHPDGFFNNVVKGKFIEMSPKDFDSVRFMLKKIHEWRATETKKREEYREEVVSVARHCVAGLLNGSMTPNDVDHRLKWLSSLPVVQGKNKSVKNDSKKDEVVQRTSWHTQGITVRLGDAAKRANDVFLKLAEMAPDKESRNQMEAFIATFETLLFDKELVICDVARATLDAIEYRLKNNLPLSQILKCKTYDQLRQTIRDITAVGETFDWFGEQLQDELKESSLNGIKVQDLKQYLARFKASVTEALYGGTMDLNIVSSRLKVLFDVPQVEFVKFWLAGRNPQITLDSFWKACEKMGAKVKKPSNVASLDTLTLEIQKNPKLENVGQAYLYAFEQYERRSPYLKNKATLSERIHFRKFIRGIWKHSGNERAIEGGNYSLNLEYGGVLAEHFLPQGINIPDFVEWHNGDPRFACGEDIVFDIYEEVFKRVQASLTGADEFYVNKNPND